MMTNEQISQKANEYGSHEYEQDAFYAGAKWMQEQSMRWVKASEMLPPKAKALYVIRYKDGVNMDQVMLAYLFYIKEAVNFYSDLEWLYEPPTTE